MIRPMSPSFPYRLFAFQNRIGPDFSIWRYGHGTCIPGDPLFDAGRFLASAEAFHASKKYESGSASAQQDDKHTEQKPEKRFQVVLLNLPASAGHKNAYCARTKA